MPDILLEATINASPEKVYQALTEQEGIRSWWTQQASAVPKVGTVSEFGFYGGQVLMKMEVTQIEPNKRRLEAAFRRAGLAGDERHLGFHARRAGDEAALRSPRFRARLRDRCR